MGFDRGLTDIEPVGDLFVAGGFNDQSRDLPLAGLNPSRLIFTSAGAFYHEKIGVRDICDLARTVRCTLRTEFAQIQLG